jgi:hypothetical protein
MFLKIMRDRPRIRGGAIVDLIVVDLHVGMRIVKANERKRRTSSALG